jgi:hypothetical protein
LSGNTLILNGTGTNKTVYTFPSKANTLTYTKHEFHAELLKVTNQTKPATLTSSSFGMNDAGFDFTKKDNLFREEITKGEIA